MLCEQQCHYGRRLAYAAAFEGDTFCQDLFYRAGKWLGRLARAAVLLQARCDVDGGRKPQAALSDADDEVQLPGHVMIANHLQHSHFKSVPHVHFDGDSTNATHDGSHHHIPATAWRADVVCTGTMWTYFPLMREGFLDTVFAVESRIAGEMSPVDVSTGFMSSGSSTHAVNEYIRLLYAREPFAGGVASAAAKVSSRLSLLLCPFIGKTSRVPS